MIEPNSANEDRKKISEAVPILPSHVPQWFNNTTLTIDVMMFHRFKVGKTIWNQWLHGPNRNQWLYVGSIKNMPQTEEGPGFPMPSQPV